jgi:hypothetical protein
VLRDQATQAESDSYAAGNQGAHHQKWTAIIPADPKNRSARQEETTHGE